MYTLNYQVKGIWYKSEFEKLNQLKRAVRENFWRDEYLQLTATIYKDDEYIEYKACGMKHFSRVRKERW